MADDKDWEKKDDDWAWWAWDKDIDWGDKDKEAEWGEKDTEAEWSEKDKDDDADGKKGEKKIVEQDEQLTQEMLIHAGAQREFLLYVPTTYQPDTIAPLVFNFHGFGGSAEGQLLTSDWRRIAEKDAVIVVYPQGSELESGSPHWNPHPASADNKSSSDDLGFISSLIDDLSENYSVDKDRIYATGYSNGAGMAYGLAHHLDKRFAAIAPVSGLMSEDLARSDSNGHPVALIHFNGTEDRERSLDGFDGHLASVDDMLAYWSDVNKAVLSETVKLNQTSGLTIERSDYSLETGETPVQSYIIHGGGHDWFDLSVDGKNLDQLIWSFLSNVSRDGERLIHRPAPGWTSPPDMPSWMKDNRRPDGMYTQALESFTHPVSRDTWMAPMGGFAIDWSAIPQPFSIDGSSPLYGTKKRADAAGDGNSEALRFDGLGVFFTPNGSKPTEGPSDLDGDDRVHPFRDGLLIAASSMAVEMAAGRIRKPALFNPKWMDAVINPAGRRTRSLEIREQIKRRIEDAALDSNSNGMLDIQDAKTVLCDSLGTFPGQTLPNELAAASRAQPSSIVSLSSADQQNAIDQAGWF